VERRGPEVRDFVEEQHQRGQESDEEAEKCSSEKENPQKVTLIRLSMQMQPSKDQGHQNGQSI
jgi:hypothetical protein